jgi:phosphate acetyltransferase
MSSPSPIFDGGGAFSAPLVQHLRRHPKRIVFPDGHDPRVLHAAAELVRLECVAPILLGHRSAIQALAQREGVKLDFIGVIEPAQSADFPLFCERYRKISRYRRVKVSDPGEVMAKPVYYAAMMLQYGYADGLVGGNLTPASAFYRAIFHMLKKLPEVDALGSCTPLTLPGSPHLGDQGTLFFSDCAIIPSPTVAQLAMLAVETARAALLLTAEKPRVALLSYSTRGSVRDAATQRIAAAAGMARDLAHREFLKVEIDGELELDAALDPAVAAAKSPSSPLGGQANVLIFPGLTAASAAAKLLEITAGAQAAGHLILGLARPAAGVTPTASAGTIFRAALATAVRSTAYRAVIAKE